MKSALILSMLLLGANDEPVKTETKPTTTQAEQKSTKPESDVKNETPEKVVKKVDTFADVIVRLTNNERARFGRGGVKGNQQLNAAAQSLANYMASTGRFSHYADGRYPSTRVRQQNFRGVYVGENIVMQGGYSSNNKEYYAKRIMQTWMNSPGHRNNILNYRAGQLGIAIATGRNGMTYAVMVLGSP